jgi:dipeptide/tripeptide permease
MQPYFFPYIGYFQLINAVDKFVIYDDVNFIKGGWINRNRILFNGEPLLINIQMQGASSFKKINEIKTGKNKEKILSTITHSYRKAPFYDEVYPLVFDIINYNEDNLALYISNSIKDISKYLFIETDFILSSEIKKDNDLKAQEKILSICKLLCASKYYNAFGGQELYNKDEFAANNIDLKFIKSKLTAYKQFNNEFIQCLSIIDVMMFNSKAEIKEMLNQYEFV